MTDFVKYDLTTGEIIASGNAPDDMIAIQAQPGEGTLKVYDEKKDSTHFVDLTNVHTAVPKANMNLTVDKTSFLSDASDKVTITLIPIGTEVITPNGSIIVNDGILEITSDVDREFTFLFRNFKFFVEEITVVAG